jgi:Putative Actinobacterial Holin-X, holin superfamily III
MTETVDTEASLPAEEETEEHEQAPAAEQEQDSSLTALLEQFGREAGVFGRASLQLEAARNMPEVRRVAREVAFVVVGTIATIAAFAFLNVAAMEGLSKAMASWLAALVLAAIWIVVACVLLFGYMEHARRWLVWIAFKAPPQAALDELERKRDEAGQAMRATAERIGPVVAIEIATAAIPDAGEVAGDVAGGVIEVGGTVLEASDEIVDVIAGEIPGGGVVAQAWDVVLIPGRFGVRIATTVLRRVTRPPEG